MLYYNLPKYEKTSAPASRLRRYAKGGALKVRDFAAAEVYPSNPAEVAQGAIDYGKHWAEDRGLYMDPSHPRYREMQLRAAQQQQQQRKGGFWSWFRK